MPHDTLADTVPPSDERFAANLEAIAKWAPNLHARLSRIEQTHSQLVTRPDGGLDMCLQRQYFYNRDAADYAHEQLEGYRRAPVRRFFSRPDPAALDGTAGAFCSRLTGRMAEHGIALTQDRVESSSFYTVVFGVGLGMHLEPLVRMSACRALILIEPNIENIYHSLSVIDWVRLFEPDDGPPRDIRFIVASDPASLGVLIHNAIRGLSPALLDGCYIFTHYYSSVLENAKERFQRDFFLFLTGLGYFEDELIMSANAAGNLRHCPLSVIDGPLLQRDEPLFIVGSGPSVDSDMAFIKAHAERAAIFSIGSGIHGLLANGIRPNFHIELENGILNLRNLEITRDEFGLHGITLIGAMTVHPDVTALFDDLIMFFRERLTPTMLFGEHCGTLSPSGPTVANTGLAAAILLGFREVYLFGVDMGARVAAKYHSKDSLVGRGQRAETVDLTSTLTLPANFGGEACTERVLAWSRSVLEVMLRGHPGVRCYNCSDGVRIEGAIAKVSRAVELSARRIDREALRADIHGQLVVYSEERRARVWDYGQRHAEVEQFVAQLCTIIDRAALQPDPGRTWVYDLSEAVHFESDGPQHALSFVYGSIVMMLGATWWYERRLNSPEAQRRFRRLAMVELRTAIEAMASRLAQLYEDIDEFFAGNLDRVPVTYPE